MSNAESGLIFGINAAEDRAQLGPNIIFFFNLSLARPFRASR